MKLVYHPGYEKVYESDPAARAGRMESIIKEFDTGYEFIEPEPASIEDVRLIHSDQHIEHIRKSQDVFDIALLAVGGAIKASETAIAGEPAFALIRPPGHHASPDHCWGFCFFNNIAISIARLMKNGSISSALILDFDLHFGDGTENAFSSTSGVNYFHPEKKGRSEFVDSISRYLSSKSADIIAVSAGFDRHEDDWGGQLRNEDYREIGRLVKEYSEGFCRGRSYGVLEGGYNHSVLGSSVRTFVDGMS